MTAVHAAAPLRLDLAGGWSDVPPFSAREGGMVVTAAIELCARAEVRAGGTTVRLVSEDLSDALEFASAAELPRNGRLALLAAGLRMLPPGPCCLTTRCDAPPGSGLGSSGALDVAIVAALSRARGEARSVLELAELACHLEAVEAGVPGGRQDQHAAALGGFQQLEFADPDVRVTPLAPRPAFARELARRFLLCYMGASRFSGDTIARVMRAYVTGDAAVAGALRTLKGAGYEMADALRSADLPRVGDVLRRNWIAQQMLDPAMCTPEMARLERAVMAAGALGGKAAGSGAGGCMFFLTGDDPAPAIAAARAEGVTVLPVQWADEGVRVW